MLSHSKLIKIRSVFAVSFILTISMALTSYIDSSFIETFVGSKIEYFSPWLLLVPSFT
ncbi:MAG: hypothetical protein R3B55_01675 [Candidatus Paceibacterota bacterium]